MRSIINAADRTSGSEQAAWDYALAILEPMSKEPEGLLTYEQAGLVEKPLHRLGDVGVPQLVKDLFDDEQSEYDLH